MLLSAIWTNMTSVAFERAFVDQPPDPLKLALVEILWRQVDERGHHLRDGSVEEECGADVEAPSVWPDRARRSAVDVAQVFSFVADVPFLFEDAGVARTAE